MLSSTYNTQYYSLPRQRIPESEKTPEWKIESVRSIAALASGNNAQDGQRSTRQEKQINYSLFNGDLDENNFRYVTDPMGIGSKYGGHPAKLEMQNIIKPKIELLKGEEGARPFNWMVRGTSGQVLTIKTEKQRELLVQFARQQILAKMGLNPNNDEDMAKTPEQVKKYMDTEFMDHREITANQVLNYIVKRDHVARKFNEGWEHALIVSEELYYVGIKEGHPHVRVVNPLSFEYDKDSDERFIEDAEWAREERFMHPSSILDFYQDELTDDEIEMIEEGNIMSSAAEMQTGFAYQEGVSPVHHGNYNNGQNQILVTSVAWRGWKEVWFLTDLDPETNQMLTTIVDPSYSLTKEQKKRGAKLESRYDKRIYIGTMIGSDIFVDIRESDIQNGKLPYCGYIYNSTNSKATSLIDLTKPHQYTYIIVWWRLMGELAKAKGKKFVMDLAMLPKSHGLDMSQWTYQFDRLDIAWINSLEESGPAKLKATQNFLTQVDMSMSNNVATYIAVLDKIERQVAQITGVSPQRESQVMASESATGVNTAVVQSSYITEPLFRYHNEVKKQVLTKILEVAKIAYKDGVKIQYVVDELYSINLNINKDELSDSDYGLFVSDSSKDYQTKQELKDYLKLAIQQDKVTMRDIVKLLNSESTAEYEHYLVEADDRKRKEANEMEEKKMQVQKQISDSQIAAQKDIADRQDLRDANKNKTAIEVATIQNQAKDEDRNGVPDILEHGKLQNQNLKVVLDSQGKQRDLDIKEAKSNSDSRLKADDNRIKEKKVDLDHQDSQKDRTHEKQMADKEEKIMEKQDQFKDKDFNRTIKLDNHKLKHESKMGDAKVKTAEKSVKVDKQKAELKMKLNADKVKTAKAMPKIKTKPKSK